MNPLELDQKAIDIYYSTGDYDLCIEIYEYIFERSEEISKEQLNHFLSNMRYSIKQIRAAGGYTFYPAELPRRRAPIGLISLSITSCKRPQLFIKTFNSFINCCKDIHLIDRFICVDDQTAPADIEIIKSMYPFLDVISKQPSARGHPQSMNIIIDEIESKYILHLEDDWEFVRRRAYIKDAISTLDESSLYGQCVFNRNYAETIDDHDIQDGVFKQTRSGMNFFEHIYDASAATRAQKNVMYWPHFSLNPCVIRKNIFDVLGKFSLIPGFEMEYGCRYIDHGYKTIFLDAIHCTHIGRLNKDRRTNQKNAYDLNGTIQFQ